MKPMPKILLLLFVSFMLCGFAFDYYIAHTEHYETVCYHEVMRKGDTFYNIASQYYNAENEKECFDEWLTIQKQRNRRLFFKEDNTPRILQIGDIVCIEVRERVVNK